jgi:hypothetical protein
VRSCTSARSRRLADLIFILGTSSPVFAAIAGWVLTRRAKTWIKVLCIVASLFLSLPIGVLLVIQSVMPTDSDLRPTPGVGVVLMPFFGVWIGTAIAAMVAPVVIRGVKVLRGL